MLFEGSFSVHELGRFGAFLLTLGSWHYDWIWNYTFRKQKMDAKNWRVICRWFFPLPTGYVQVFPGECSNICLSTKPWDKKKKSSEGCIAIFGWNSKLFLETKASTGASLLLPEVHRFVEIWTSQSPKSRLIRHCQSCLCHMCFF